MWIFCVTLSVFGLLENWGNRTSNHHDLFPLSAPKSAKCLHLYIPPFFSSEISMHRLITCLNRTRSIITTYSKIEATCECVKHQYQKLMRHFYHFEYSNTHIETLHWASIFCCIRLLSNGSLCTHDNSFLKSLFYSTSRLNTLNGILLISLAAIHLNETFYANGRENCFTLFTYPDKNHTNEIYISFFLF